MKYQFKAKKTCMYICGLGIFVAGVWLARSSASPTGPHDGLMPRSMAGKVQRSTSREPPPPAVIFDVADLSSGIGAKPLRIIVNNGTQAVKEDMLRAIVARTSLRTWPAMEVVPSNIQIHPTEGSVSVQLAYLEIAPKEAPNDGWYGLHIAALPAPFVWPRENEDNVLEDGAHMARFRVASGPVVRGARIVDKPDGRQLRIEFSEPLFHKDALENAVVRGKGLEECWLITTEPSILQTEARLSCTSKIRDKDAEIMIGRGLQSRDGKELEGGMALAYVISPKEWVERTDGTWWAQRRLKQ